MMSTAAPEHGDHLRRSASGCLCCGSTDLRYETQIVSGFLAARAWGGPPQLTQLANCGQCGLRFFDRGLSDAETARYYRGYRDADYIRTRRRWEPFYTRGQHAALLAWSESPLRLTALRGALAAANAPARFSSALDHGGDQGHMLGAVSAERKAVFDPSARATLPGVDCFAELAALPRNWELILSCQVLEHVSSPVGYLRELGALLADSGWLYIEVPAENWRPAPGQAALRAAWLAWLLRWRPLLVAADVLCTVCRIKLGRLPPLGFVAMREHLNYFSAGSLAAVLGRTGFTVVAGGTNGAGQLYAIARKFVTVASEDGVINSPFRRNSP
jgi:hypothetical protein